MKKQGTVFVNTPQIVNEELPSNHEAQPISAAEENKQQEAQAIAVSQLQNLAKDEQPVLLSLQTVFPFKFFPTEVIVEKTKVSVKNTIFFRANEIQSILISDISSCETESSLFFGLLKIVPRIPNEPPIIINYLPKSEAQKARRIIQGLIVGVMNKVDLTKISTVDLLQNIEQVGDSKAAL